MLLWILMILVIKEIMFVVLWIVFLWEIWFFFLFKFWIFKFKRLYVEVKLKCVFVELLWNKEIFKLLLKILVEILFFFK